MEKINNRDLSDDTESIFFDKMGCAYTTHLHYSPQDFHGSRISGDEKKRIKVKIATTCKAPGIDDLITINSATIYIDFINFPEFWSDIGKIIEKHNILVAEKETEVAEILQNFRRKLKTLNNKGD